MKHYDILVITNNKIDTTLFKDLNCLIIPHADIELNICTYSGVTFTWDYLITDNGEILSNFDLLTEDGFYVTNCFFQSTIDEIFVVGKLNHSTYDLNSQISIIIDFLLDT